MRKVNPNTNNAPPELSSAECLAHLNLIITNPDTNKAKGDLYKGKYRDPATNLDKFRTVERLKQKYECKCGYCERQCYEPVIDHHRPVGFVTGGNTHNNGYYWLSYEWTNFVASCTDCNRRPYKGTQYPINGNRNVRPLRNRRWPIVAAYHYRHVYNTGEAPKLLHPEYINNPMVHFKFDTDGKIHGKTNEGKETVKVCGLDRKDLNVWRNQLYESFNIRFEVVVKKYLSNREEYSLKMLRKDLTIIFTDLIARCSDETKEYTLFTSYLLKDFDIFFLEKPFGKIVSARVKPIFAGVIKNIIS